MGIFAAPLDSKHEEHTIEKFAREHIRANPSIQVNSKLALALNFTTNPTERETTIAILISALTFSKISDYRNINIALKFVTSEERNIINAALIDLAFKSETLNKRALSALAISIKHEIKRADRIKWIELMLTKLKDHHHYEAKKKFLNHFLSPLTQTLPEDEIILFNPLLNESILILDNHLNVAAERIITAIQFTHARSTFLQKNAKWADIDDRLSKTKQDIESKSSLRCIETLRDDEISSLYDLEKAIPSRYLDSIIHYLLTFTRSHPPNHYWVFLKDAYRYLEPEKQQQMQDFIANRINDDHSSTDQNWLIHDIFMSMQNLEDESKYLAQIIKIMKLRASACTLEIVNSNDNSLFMCDLYSHYLAKINQTRAQREETQRVLFEKTELPDVLIGVMKNYI
jgi:hypothetical protein